MAIRNLHDFLSSYFTAHHCTLEQINDGVLSVQLNEKMDRALMNRPFYWHYVKKMGSPGQPMKLTLITDPEKRDGKNEWIHFGSPRLQQILQHLSNNEKYTKLFEKINTNQKTALFPWLITNIKISYQGKQKRDEIISIGLHLVNGEMKVEMMEELQNKSLQMTIADYCYTISPIIKLNSGFKRIESVLESYINDQSHNWADESLKTMEEEINLVKHFYSGKDGDEQTKQEMEKEIEEITKRYKPYVKFKVINGGIFYLTQ
ncbi:YqhG family protein [Virgibacillus doumboii]|uniref:YqhG family protein n=1 Tax=Virgibacillus doumboii TaxID=2697503 RepID=UPI0013E00E8F|nr:YqhG family protein [Virgibacillus doumboii]